MWRHNCMRIKTAGLVRLTWFKGIKKCGMGGFLSLLGGLCSHTANTHLCPFWTWICIIGALYKIGRLDHNWYFNLSLLSIFNHYRSVYGRVYVWAYSDLILWNKLVQLTYECERVQQKLIWQAAAFICVRIRTGKRKLCFFHLQIWFQMISDGKI